MIDVNVFQKLAEENLKQKIKEKAKIIIPLALGSGAGIVAANQLKHQLSKIQSPAAKNIAKGAIIIGTPIMASAIVPSLRREWEKLLFDHKKDT